MSNDTICTQEQPCKQSDCPYCDPFADPVNASRPADLGAANLELSGVYVSSREEAPMPPSSPIPSLSECYLYMRICYTEYETAIANLALAENAATQDRIDLETAKTAVLLKYTDPKELGSNEAQRAAAITFHVQPQTQKLQAALRSVELLKCEAEIKRVRVRFADNQLRFLEASLGMHRQTEH